MPSRISVRPKALELAGIAGPVADPAPETQSPSPSALFEVENYLWRRWCPGFPFETSVSCQNRTKNHIGKAGNNHGLDHLKIWRKKKNRQFLLRILKHRLF